MENIAEIKVIRTYKSNKRKCSNCGSIATVFEFSNGEVVYRCMNCDINSKLNKENFIPIICEIKRRKTYVPTGNLPHIGIKASLPTVGLRNKLPEIDFLPE